MRTIHYYSGLLIAVFVFFHLFNHAGSLFGAAAHIELMNSLQVVYRNDIVEILLLGAVLVQIVSGLKLFWATRQTASTGFDKLHRWTGLYMAIFL